MDDKVLLHILNTVWSYGMEPWGCASKSNTVLMHRLESKTLKTITKPTRFIYN